jgi:hypothetical protein
MRQQRSHYSTVLKVDRPKEANSFAMRIPKAPADIHCWGVEVMPSQELKTKK